MTREFDVVVERDAEGFYIASVPALPGCHTQAKSLHELWPESGRPSSFASRCKGSPVEDLDFIGIQRVTIEHDGPARRYGQGADCRVEEDRI